MTDAASPDPITPHDLGAFGEAYAAGRLTMLGVPVRRGGPADLLIHGDTPVEIKISRCRPINDHLHGYQFSIHRDGRDGLQAPFIILICWRQPWIDSPVFVIPAPEITRLKCISIPNPPETYRGRYSQWLNTWDLLQKPRKNGKTAHPAAQKEF